MGIHHTALSTPHPDRLVGPHCDPFGFKVQVDFLEYFDRDVEAGAGQSA